MPKQVDHDQRRAEIIDATWQLIAEHGIDAITMREISAAIGMANGALKHYYPGKNAIITAAFTQVFEAIDGRVRESLGDATGLAGLRVFCSEILPIEEVAVQRARVVIPLWQRALTDAELGSVFVDAMGHWREQILGFLRSGRADGSVTSSMPDDVVAEQLVAILLGIQTLACLTPEATTPTLRRQVVDSFLDGLARPGASNPPAVRRVAAPAPAPLAGSPAARRSAGGFLSFAETALDTTTARLAGSDRSAMAMVLLLHRVTNSVVYDLESTVHRPAGWSWSAFRLLFVLWVSGPLEAGRAAELAGMSRAAVSSLARTLSGSGLVDRAPDLRDRRGVVLSLTTTGHRRLQATLRAHNRREVEWAELLSEDELSTLNTVLATLALAAQTHDWISHRR